MMFYRLVLYDLKQGFRGNGWKYFLSFLVFLMAILWLKAGLDYGYLYGSITDTPAFADVVLYLLRGMRPYDPQREKTFLLPVIWLLNQALLLFLTASYPFRDLKHYGQQVLLRTRQKTAWWFSKCIWCAGSVTVFYLLAYLAAALGGYLIGASFSGGFSLQLAKLWYGSDLSRISEGELWFQLLVMPWGVSMAMGFLQMYLGLWFGTQVSYLLVMGALAAATFLPAPQLLGNYSMILRCSAIAPDGLEPIPGLVRIAVYMAASVVLGAVRMKRMDVLV